MQRKKFFGTLGLLIASITLFPMDLIESTNKAFSNFKFIYANNSLKKSFYNFLVNVFHLYPTLEFHQLITEISKNKNSDKDIYIDVQNKLNDITPFFSAFTYKLPALFKQKEEMAKQSLTLLGEGSTFDGYLEIGSLGRYLDYLEENVNINGSRYYSDGKTPSYSIVDMIDRGQITLGAEYIQMTDYNTDYSKHIPSESLDLVTVYIGFHHCPIQLRNTFIGSINKVMRKGGKLILRDHDCTTDEQKVLVALAHDVFNMGTLESWEYNAEEIRNFYSLEFICKFVEDIGFKFEKQTLFQKGDPTKNALMLFTKI